MGRREKYTISILYTISYSSIQCSDAGDFTLDNVRKLPKDVSFVFVAFAIIAVFTFKIPPKFESITYFN